MSTAARNVLILLVLAAGVAFLPGGGRTAAFVSAFLSIGILASFVMLAGRYYREHRVALFGLGDRHRGMLYAAVGLAVIAMAARQELFTTGPGILAWFVMIGAASAMLYAVWRHHRSYNGY